MSQIVPLSEIAGRSEEVSRESGEKASRDFRLGDLENILSIQWWPSVTFSRSPAWGGGQGAGGPSCVTCQFRLHLWH